MPNSTVSRVQTGRRQSLPKTATDGGVQQYIPFLRVAIPFFTIKAMKAELSRQLAVALYVVAMAGVIVGVDFAFFRNRLLERLTVNIGIVLVFAAFYLRFLRRP
jgi:hypothetical protein